MSNGASVAERAVGLPWLRPAPSSLMALTADPPDPVSVVSDPAAVAHVLRYCRPTATHDAHPFTAGGLSQPSLLGAAADLLQQIGSTLPPLQPLAQFVQTVGQVAGRIALLEHLDPLVVRAVASVVPLGWLAVTAVEPISCAELRFRLAAPASQQEAWGLDAVAIGRRLAARWRLPEWVTATIGLIRLHPTDAARAGAPKRLFTVVQRAVAAVEAERLRVGLTDPNAQNLHLAEDVMLVRGCRDEEVAVVPLPTWVQVRLLRAVATNRRGCAAIWQTDADARADRLADSLAKLRADWNAELRDAKLAGLAEFAAGASHEINNPLAVIAGHAQLLLQKEVDPQRQRQLASILRQTERVHDLLRGTLHFARPPAARRGATDIAVLLADCAERHSAEAAGRGIRVTVSAEDGLIAPGDPDQLRRAVVQLVRNAIDAVPDGGEVRLSAVRVGERLFVRVADSGPGPAATAVPHLFDPFFSGKSAGRGRGLGLSIAWRLARQNGGDLRFDPTPGEPSRFTLSLPLMGPLRLAG